MFLHKKLVWVPGSGSRYNAEHLDGNMFGLGHFDRLVLTYTRFDWPEGNIAVSPRTGEIRVA